MRPRRAKPCPLTGHACRASVLDGRSIGGACLLRGSVVLLLLALHHTASALLCQATRRRVVVRCFRQPLDRAGCPLENIGARGSAFCESDALMVRPHNSRLSFPFSRRISAKAADDVISGAASPGGSKHRLN
ncbi:hypothetical protein MRX96_007055 [Rhipicephalus microplus]